MMVVLAGLASGIRIPLCGKSFPMTESSVPMEITCRDVKTRLETGPKFLFLDCREPDEYALVKIDGTTLLPMSRLVERAGELSGKQAEDIVVHCHHGGRSLRVAMWLRQQGFARAVSMAGGIDQWATEIDPTLARY